jgi:hypothetical protein
MCNVANYEPWNRRGAMNKTEGVALAGHCASGNKDCFSVPPRPSTSTERAHSNIISQAFGVGNSPNTQEPIDQQRN